MPAEKFYQVNYVKYKRAKLVTESKQPLVLINTIYQYYDIIYEPGRPVSQSESVAVAEIV